MKTNIKWGIIALLLFNIALAKAQEKFREVRVEVVDPLNEKPMEGVFVDVDARIVKTLPNGDEEMLSFDNLNELYITGTTDSNGIATVNVPINSTNLYITVKVSKNGYDSMINMATLVSKTNPTTIFIEMLPNPESNLSISKNTATSNNKLDDFIWNRKIKLEAKKIENNYNLNEDLNARSTLPKNGKHSKIVAKNSTASIVPQTVYVRGLKTGYPQSCGSSASGFTGNINLDDYIAGVIDAELGSSFPTEALKAQSVASRTFALNNVEEGRPANCGHAYKTNISEKSMKAAKATSGVVVLYKNNIISAFYAARCNGDYTLSASVESCIGKVSGASAYIPSVSCSGHVNCKSAEGGSNCCTKYNPERKRNETVFGHGLGLCQRGSQDFANRGWSWERIVTHYYRNISLSSNSSSCKSELELNGVIGSNTYKSSKSIIASGTISSTRTVVFNAASKINLKAGFVVKEGATFTAKIGTGCTGSKEFGLSPSDLLEESSSSALKDAIKLYPNPANQDAFLQVKASKNSAISYKFFDISGKIIIADQYVLAKNNGVQQLVVKTNFIPNGIYFCKIQVGANRVTRKLQIIHK